MTLFHFLHLGFVLLPENVNFVDAFTSESIELRVDALHLMLVLLLDACSLSLGVGLVVVPLFFELGFFLLELSLQVSSGVLHILFVLVPFVFLNLFLL